jgi:hypothetical protein
VTRTLKRIAQLGVETFDLAFSRFSFFGSSFSAAESCPAVTAVMRNARSAIQLSVAAIVKVRKAAERRS